MTHARFAVIPAVYVALLRAGANPPDRAGGAAGPDGPPAPVEVLLQLRRGTTFMDGWWACGAAGHVERGETLLEAAGREAAEELGVELDPTDLTLAVTTTRRCVIPDDLEERVDVFLTATRWSGDPAIVEPDKAGDLQWWPLDALPQRLVPHERAALEAIAAGQTPAVQAMGFAQHLTLVAAVGRNGVIGDGSSMPWHLPQDLKFFKATTMGGVMVMGRGTWDSIGRALPGRRTIVVTRQPDWSAPGAETARSLREALLIAGDGEVFIVGGGQIFAQTMEHAHRLIITQVDLDPAGSTRFPPIDPEVWREVARLPGDGGVLAWVTWERC